MTETGFNDWRRAFLQRAQSIGISTETIERCQPSLKLLPEILDKQSNQTEFNLTISDYIARVVSDKRVRNGRSNFRFNRELLTQLSECYKVDPQIIMAIWGVETNYGKTRGDWSVLAALSNLAHAGHRANFFEDELLAAFQIVESGDIAPTEMKGSWAGAMGHGQFMPSSFQKFAVDHDGDGRRNIWADDPEDGLASIANYLSQHGWQMNRPCCLEIRLPDGFDYATAGRQTKLSATQWMELGVTTVDDSPAPDYGDSSVILPSGASGPAFMVFSNFDVILTYNRAEAYAISVGHLADRLQGGRPIRKTCPTDLVVLGRDALRELQTRLTQMGFDTLGADGFPGPNTASALRAYQKTYGLVADGFWSGAMLEHVTAQTT